MSGTPPKNKSTPQFQEIHNRVSVSLMNAQWSRYSVKGRLNKKLKMDEENTDTVNLFGQREKRPRYKRPKLDAFTSSLPPISKLKIKEKKNLNSFPKHLLFLVIAYMDMKDVVRNVHAISKHFRETCNDARFWKYIEGTKPIPMCIRVRKMQCIVERRSKGKLYKGIDRITGKRCTLRRILLDVTNAGHDDGVPTSILRELSLIKQMDHINIAKILGAEVSGRVMQMSFEHYEMNMKDYMKFFTRESGKPSTYKMPTEKIKSIMFMLLQGLSFIHHKGIMHRNLKIDNLLLTEEGVLKLADFSLCRMVTLPTVPYTPEDPKERERSGREARRLWYRAPELLFRKSLYSLEVDMWSVGCLLAELILGEPLFNGETEIEQLFRIFRFTGVPLTYSMGTNDFPGVKLPHWNRVYFGYICADKSSNEYRQIINAYIPGREHALAKLQEIKDRVGLEGLDLLWRLLEVDPQKRITANEAIKHSFLSNTPLPIKLSTGKSNVAFPYYKLPCNPFNAQGIKCVKTYPLGMPPECHIASYADFLHEKEFELVPDVSYMTKQHLITESMRSILVDWLVDVSVHFEVMSETLHYAIGYIDRTLSLTKIDKAKLQLVGVTCMKIADVFNENSKEYYRQENATEYAYITADEYKAEEVIQMEKEIITLLGFQMFSPTTIHFLKVYNTICKLDEKVIILASYLSDLLLLNYHSLKYAPSLRASAALFIASLALEQTIKAEDRLRCRDQFGWFTVEELTACVGHVRSCWIESRNNSFFSRFDAVNNKYDNLQTLLSLRTMYAPHVPSNKLDQWFYTRRKTDSEGKCPMEIF